MSSRDLVRVMGQQIHQLHGPRYELTDASRLEITPLNSNAALIHAHWTRLGKDDLTLLAIDTLCVHARFGVRWQVATMLVADAAAKPSTNRSSR